MSAGLRVKKQSINITVDQTTRDIAGFTEIEFETTSKIPPQAIFLSARQMKINSVEVNQNPAEYKFIDSRRAFDFDTTQLIRDATNFTAVCLTVLQSPDLVIPIEQGMLNAEAQENQLITFIVKVEFQVNSDSTAIIRENDVIFTDNEADGPSSWFPCVDTRAQRSYYTLIITFSDKLICIGPGESTIIAADQKTHMNSIQYKVTFPVVPSAIGFALGPFNTESFKSEFYDSKIYYLSDKETFLETVKPIPEIFQDVMTHLDYEDPLFHAMSFVSLPFLSKIRMFPGAFFFPPSIMLPLGNVNVIPVVIPKIIEAVFAQFVLYLFPIPIAKREWLQTGFISYFADIIANKYFTNCFQPDKRWSDLNTLFVEDIHQEVLLHSTDPATGNPFQDEYLKIKAKLLINMLSQTMQNSETTLLMLMRKSLKNSEDKTDFFVQQFYDDLKKFSSIDFKKFSKQWLKANGFPIFTFNFHVDKRQHNVKIVIYQRPSCPTSVEIFSGQIVAQLQDLKLLKNSPFSIVSKIQQQSIAFYATRYKRKKEIYTLQNLETVQIEVLSALLWIALDPKPTWICQVHACIPEHMLHHQIDLRRDAFVQHQLISDLCMNYANSPLTIQLFKTLLYNTQQDPNTQTKVVDYYYGVRCHAARALAKCDTESNDHKHADILYRWYLKEFCENEKKDCPKCHDFNDIPRHYVQLDVIKSLSIIRTGENYTPHEYVELLHTIMDKAKNTTNVYNDDSFNAEVELALGRINPDNEEMTKTSWKLISSKLILHATIPSFCNIITSSGYTALTAISLKNIGNPNIPKPVIADMRGVVQQNSNYYEARAIVFKCLLYLCMYPEEFKISFAELVSDIKRLADNKMYFVAALCLREIYRLILNGVYEGTGDRFESYLLFISKEKFPTRDALRDFLINDANYHDEIVETLWSILTKSARHYSYLRSEALRVYTTLYGKDCPYKDDKVNLMKAPKLVTAYEKSRLFIFDKNDKSTYPSQSDFIEIPVEPMKPSPIQPSKITNKPIHSSSPPPPSQSKRERELNDFQYNNQRPAEWDAPYQRRSYDRPLQRPSSPSLPVSKSRQFNLDKDEFPEKAAGRYSSNPELDKVPQQNRRYQRSYDNPPPKRSYESKIDISEVQNDVKSPIRSYDQKSPVRQYEQKSPVRQYEQKSPVRPYEQKSPVRQYEPKSPVRQYEQKSPVRQYEQKPPIRQYEQKSPVRQYEQKSPVRPYEQKSPVSKDDIQKERERQIERERQEKEIERERERKERERQEKERQEKLEKERQERLERLEKERQERLEKERQERIERIEKERQERLERLEKERLEKERQEREAERERQEREKKIELANKKSETKQPKIRLVTGSRSQQPSGDTSDDSKQYRIGRKFPKPPPNAATTDSLPEKHRERHVSSTSTFKTKSASSDSPSNSPPRSSNHSEDSKASDSLTQPPNRIRMSKKGPKLPSSQSQQPIQPSPSTQPTQAPSAPSKPQIAKKKVPIPGNISLQTSKSASEIDKHTQDKEKEKEKKKDKDKETKPKSRDSSTEKKSSSNDHSSSSKKDKNKERSKDKDKEKDKEKNREKDRTKDKDIRSSSSSDLKKEFRSSEKSSDKKEREKSSSSSIDKKKKSSEHKYESSKNSASITPSGSISNVSLTGSSSASTISKSKKDNDSHSKDKHKEGRDHSRASSVDDKESERERDKEKSKESYRDRNDRDRSHNDRDSDRDRRNDRDRDRDRDRRIDRDRDRSERDREKDRERDREKDRDRSERDREKDRDRRSKDRDRSDRDRDRDRDRSERDRDRDRSERDRDRDRSERDRDRDRRSERDRDKDRERGGYDHRSSRGGYRDDDNYYYSKSSRNDRYGSGNGSDRGSVSRRAYDKPIASFDDESKPLAPLPPPAQLQNPKPK